MIGTGARAIGTEAAGGAAPDETRAELSTPVGWIGVEVSQRGVSKVGWLRRSPTRSAATTGPSTIEQDSVLLDAVAQLRGYFAGERRGFDLAIDLSGLEPTTAAVLSALRTVPWGRTITYGDLAALSGTGVPPRGIGAIMGANPVPLIIPCHRVVAHDGLGGFSGGPPGQGIATKRWLLEHEGALPPALF